MRVNGRHAISGGKAPRIPNLDLRAGLHVVENRALALRDNRTCSSLLYRLSHPDSCVIVMLHIRVRPDGLMQVTKRRSNNNRRFGRDSAPASPGYASRELPLQGAR
jgi:hypothetical protein